MASTAIITKDKIATSSYDNIFTYIDDRNNVRDPKSPAGVSTRRFVYESDPLVKLSSFDGYPYIVLEFPSIEYSAESVDNKVKNVAWTHTIIVRSVRTGAVNRGNDAGKSDLFDIMDDLHELFNDESKKAELQLLRIFNIRLATIGTDTLLVKEKEVYEATLELVYSERIATSD